jgi:hypothetical protein
LSGPIGHPGFLRGALGKESHPLQFNRFYRE